MFWHLFHYRLQTLLKNKSLIFWTLVFPIILGLLFRLAFSSLDQLGRLETTNVGIVAATEAETSQLRTVLESIESEGKAVFVPAFLSAGEAQEKLNKETIAGYYQVEAGQLTLFVNEQGITQVVLEELMNQYSQQHYLSEQVSTGTVPHEALSPEKFVPQNYLQEKSSSNNFSLLSFYVFTLVGMTIMYGYMWGLNNSNDQQANQTAKGIRLSLIPISKLQVSLANLCASFVVFYSEVLVILAVFHFGYGVDFGSRWLFILLVCAIGSLMTLAFGNLLGNLLVGFNLNQKIGIGVSLSMIMSFFAGMMGSQSLKYWLDTHLPFLGRVNIVNLISESLYQLFYYQSLTAFYRNLGWLVAMTLVFIGINIFFERRTQYVHL